MGTGINIGISNTSKKVKNFYVGISDKPKKIKKAWVGVNGVPKLFYENNALPEEYTQYKYIRRNQPTIYARIILPKEINTYTQLLCNFAINYYPDQYIFKAGTGKSYECFISLDNICHIKKGDSSWGSNNELVFKREYNINLTKNINGDCYFDNNKIFTNMDSNISSSSIVIFPYVGNDTGNYVYISNFELYDLNNNKSLIKLIPCVRKNDNVAGFYDFVNKEFITSAYPRYLECTNEL